MKDKIKILKKNDGSIDFHFLTGHVSVPATPGCYTIACGCGAGKTTNIKSLILAKYQEGVLYCVDTLCALCEMYEFVYHNLIQTGQLQEDDVAIICSEQEDNCLKTMHTYLNDPSVLVQKKVVLTTHVRFFSSLINYFLLYRVPRNSIGCFDGDFTALMQRSDLRRWIIFDETPLFIKPFFTMSYSFLGCFSENDPRGQGMKCKSLLEIKRYYTAFISGRKDDPFKHNTVVDRIKLETVLSLIPRLYSSWVSQQKGNDQLEIYFRPVDLCQPIVNSHVLVFEGVGDILLSRTPYAMLDVSQKYSGQVQFCPIDQFQLKRQIRDNETLTNETNRLKSIISYNISHGKKTLVVCWKDQGKETNCDMEGANQSAFRDWIDEQLSKSFERNWYRVIYYGSSFCKSTNAFHDFDAIVLWGKWSFPSTERKKILSNWGTMLSGVELDTWFFTQLISRIGLRNHDPNGEYRVYYTDDFCLNLINHLNAYFQNAPIQTDKMPPYNWQDVLNEKSIYRMQRKHVQRFINAYPELKRHVLHLDTTWQNVDISRTEVMDLLETDSAHASRAISAFCRTLERLLIHLNIK